jgi:uncharacterized protein YktB (UPF0637 family)
MAINFSNFDNSLQNINIFIVGFTLIFFSVIFINKPKTKFTYKLRGKDNSIEVKVGDAFTNNGALVVPVNNEFDVDLNGNVLKANSILSLLIKRHYAGKPDHLTTDIKKIRSTSDKCPIGTTIEVFQNDKKFYLVANSIKKENNRVKSEIDDFLVTLNGLWEYIACESGRDAVVTIPLINTQHGRDASLSKMACVKEIITSYIETSKVLNVCEKITISIHPTEISKGFIDLDEINDFLKFSCEHYRQVTLEEKTNDPDTSSKIIRIEN